MMKKNKICVVGAGPWGLNHIKTLQKIGSWEVLLIKIIRYIKLMLKKFPNCLTFFKFR